MKEMTLEELHNVGYALLEVFADYCRENGIKYSLAYGTVLGAARHKGFIPWDDDVDIFVPRPDYEKLIKLYEDSERYRLVSPERDSGYKHPFAKFIDCSTVFIESHGEDKGLGVWLDIFPLDGAPNEDKQQTKMMRYYRLRRILITQGFNVKNRKEYFKEGNVPKGVASCCIGALSKFTSFEKVKKSMEKRGLEYPYRNCEYVACLWGPYGKKEVFPKQWIEDMALLKFGEHEYCVPGNYEDYLTGLYGSTWMEIPKDHGHPHGVGYWK